MKLISKWHHQEKNKLAGIPAGLFVYRDNGNEPP